MRLTLPLLALGATLLQPLAAQTILIDDTFTRTGSISGTAPTASAGSASGNTWVVSGGAGSSSVATGTQLNETGGPGQTELATLEVASALTTNTTYTFSINLPAFTPNAGTDTWFNLALTAGGLSTNTSYGNSIGGLFIRNKGNASLDYNDTLNSSLSSAQQNLLNNAVTGTQFSFTYDTATGTENFYVNSLVPTGTPAFTFTNATIPTGNVFISLNVFNGDSNDTAASVFPLSEVTVIATSDLIPEPTTYALMLGGLVLMGMWIRSRRKQTA